MAAAVGLRPDESPRDEEACSVSLHERLVAYVHSLAHTSRRGVWGEHSYARARGAGGAGAARVRTLLAASAPRAAPLDVERCSPPPAEPPAGPGGPDSDSDDTDADADDDWEERLSTAAPAAAHRRLALAAVDALRDMRLARLAGGGRAARRERARAAARRLRLALAPLWASGAPAWLHAALGRLLPRAERRLYDAALEELWRGAPRLAAALTGARAPPPAAPLPAGVGPESSPWLVWVSSGEPALDARWEPRLAALVHTRVLRGVGGAGGAEAAAPEPWCASAAAAVRAALTDALAEAGSRAVILGGCGAGGAALAVLARGAGGAGRAEGGVRGLALVAPPLSTAEGARDAADDALAGVRLPLLLVCGSRAADCARGVALRVAGARDRRLLEVRGADGRLRLPARLRAALPLPQEALDAALAEEVVRWAVETAEREEEAAGPPAPAESADEYAHLPPAAPAPAHHPHPAHPAPTKREQSGSGVVSRVSGGTPLVLAPRRAAPPALQPADIMQLPIVFADDEAAGGAAAGGAGGAAGGAPPSEPVKFTRVILAKRGGGARRVLLRRPGPPAARRHHH